MTLGRTTNRNKDGTKRVLEYYVCGAWKNKGTAVCHSNGIRASYADEYVLNRVGHFTANDKLIKDVINHINKGIISNSDPIQKEYHHLKKLIDSIQSKKDKALGLFEDGILNKTELVDRWAKLNEEMQILEERISPLEKQISLVNQQEISFNMVKTVMNNFVENYKDSLTFEQRKHLLQLIIKKITIAENKRIESIQIQLNNNVVKHFANKGEEESSDDDFSSPFLVCFEI